MTLSTLTSEELRAALRTLVANGLTFGDCVFAFADREDDGKIYIEGAFHHCKPTVISRAEDGAWVMGWLWVPDKDAWQKGQSDSDGEPCRVLNHYTCEECDESWQDHWSCECNDKCPKCAREIEPERSDYLDLAGNVIPEEDTQESSSA